MTSSVLKCTNCNIVINEVLAFVQNKVDVMVEDSLVQICATAFTEDEIEKAKSLLFDSVSKKKTLRRREGKTQRNLDDIICLIKETDPENMPIFVARDLQRLPPVTFDHVDVTRLLKDIILIQKDLGDIQNKYEKTAQTEYVTVEQFETLKTELRELKVVNQLCNTDTNVNCKRGAYCLEDSYDAHDSGPMGLLNLTDSRHPTLSSPEGTSTIPARPSFACVAGKPTDLSQSMLTVTSPSEPACARVEAHRFTAVSTAASAQVSSERTCEAPPRFRTLSTTPKQQNMVDRSSVISSADPKQTNAVIEQPDQEGWTEVKSRKSKPKTKLRFVGKKGTAIVDPTCKFRAAVPRIPLYIYNVSDEASEEDVARYIKEKVGIIVSPERVCMKDLKGYDSFKIYIPKCKLPLFDNDDLWPHGIFFRRYFMFRRNIKTDVGSRKSSQCSKNQNSPALQTHTNAN